MTKKKIHNAEKSSKLKLSQRWNFNVTCTCNFSSAIAAESAFSKLTNAQNLLGRIRTLSTWPHLLKSCSKCLSLTSSGLTLPTHSERHEPSLLLLSLNLKKSKQKLSYNLGRIKCPWNIHTCLHSSSASRGGGAPPGSASAESSKCIHMLIFSYESFLCTIEPRFTDTCLIRTPRYYGQFSLSLGEVSPQLSPSVSLLTGFDCN